MQGLRSFSARIWAPEKATVRQPLLIVSPLMETPEKHRNASRLATPKGSGSSRLLEVYMQVRKTLRYGVELGSAKLVRVGVRDVHFAVKLKTQEAWHTPMLKGREIVRKSAHPVKQWGARFGRQLSVIWKRACKNQPTREIHSMRGLKGVVERWRRQHTRTA